MPDQVDRYLPAAGADRPPDILEDFVGFAHHFPAWCDRRGEPRSWRHFRYGLAQLAREALRAELAEARAARMAGVDRDDFAEWQRDMGRMIDAGR